MFLVRRPAQARRAAGKAAAPGTFSEARFSSQGCNGFGNEVHARGAAPGTRGEAWSDDGGKSFASSGVDGYRWFRPAPEVLDAPVVMSQYGALPSLDYLDNLKPGKHEQFRQLFHNRSEVTAAFRAYQVQYIDRLRQANGLDLARARVASPVVRWVRMPLGSGFLTMVAHERRHLAQARRVLQAAGISRH